MKDVQATGGAFRHQKRTYSTSEHIISSFFLWVFFALLDPDPHSQGGSGSSRRRSMRIWIYNTDFMLGSRPGSSDVAALASSNEEDFQVDRFPFSELTRLKGTVARDWTQQCSAQCVDGKTSASPCVAYILRVLNGVVEDSKTESYV
jgi:hypothetical protein